MPEITGGEVSGLLTPIPNHGSFAVLTPSLTEIVMGVYQTGLYAMPGVPHSWPVLLLKLAQTGLPVIENTSLRPLGFFVVGVNEYGPLGLPLRNDTIQLAGWHFPTHDRAFTQAKAIRRCCRTATPVSRGIESTTLLFPASDSTGPLFACNSPRARRREALWW